MKRLLRLAALTGAVLVTLAVAGSAMAAYTTPRLLVTGDTIAVTQSKDDDPTAKVTIYVPVGYTFQLTPTTGTQIGNVEAQIQAKAISPDAIVPVGGTIVVDDPTKPQYQTPQSIGCRGATTPVSAVWLLNLSAAGQTLIVPMYVSPPAAGEAAFAAAKLQVCLPSSDVPPAQGGAALGAKLISAILKLNTGFFTAPAAENRWRAFWTPYNAGTATINAAATVETQSIAAPAGRLTLRAKYTKARKRAAVTGSLTQGTAGVAGAPVQVLVNSRRVGTVQTGSGGGYSFNVRIVRKGLYSFQARTTVPNRDLGAAGCSQTIPPIPCISAQVSGFSAVSSILRLRVR
jgi:hypothetical protein